jgi:ABC-type branched-subunit amino acid transport system ATPase component
VNAAPTTVPGIDLPAESGKTLTFTNVSVNYGGVAAVRDVSLEVAPGQLVGVIGSNGAGKTSLIDAVTGYCRTASGSVRLGSTVLDGWAPNKRARAGLVRTFQGVEIFNDLTVEENIAVGSWSSATNVRSVRSTLDAFDLADVAGRPAKELSQGGRRLLALARAVVCEPHVLVLDEPAAGLDTQESAGLGKRLRSLVEEGMGILLVEHDMSLVFAVCDLVCVLEFGEVIALGTPDEVANDARVRLAYLGS